MLMFHLNANRHLLQPPTKNRRGEVVSQTQRNRVCPAAIRAYRFLSDDISSQLNICCAVLQVPFSGIPGAPPSTVVTKESVHPSSMLVVWNDTTAAEIAMSLLREVRGDVDSAFAATESATKAEGADEVVGAANPEDNLGASREDSATAVYVIKLSVGAVSADGNATLSPIASVELRQVIRGEPLVFPSRRAGMPAVDVPISTLPYRLGDPIFFTCKRLR
ncbi:hypothetical protein, conserved [Trypanosoma brucei gambiense DAL972]|uniref:Uncharacterized protein n=2 Tax=Trypanosoma brucei TaxID=5691 RepID=C9ZUY6_TRYB9|nr:hypothetical protein, conserved [Trypanosoma brucei gambiense DAL972]RHW70945.1 hypothetical protein DPX39_080023300 [Trypanosoma brucei equiperdum]CBH13224.1 hypothetical protein, conserved [Trypanosoma brucei gambiense DAL972]|eukprot:XP_011775501.1 hypothetical protein, conserved [Trypanosoma brucei gambiense DAL972]